MGHDDFGGMSIYRISYRVRGRAAQPSPVDRLAVTRRAAEVAVIPVLADSWRVGAGDITVTSIVEVAA